MKHKDYRLLAFQHPNNTTDFRICQVFFDNGEPSDYSLVVDNLLTGHTPEEIMGKMVSLYEILRRAEVIYFGGRHFPKIYKEAKKVVDVGEQRL